MYVSMYVCVCVCVRVCMCVTCRLWYRRVKTVFLFLKVHEVVVAAVVNYMIA